MSLSPTAGPLWIAYEAGFFKRNNVSAELLYIPGGFGCDPCIGKIPSGLQPETAQICDWQYRPAGVRRFRELRTIALEPIC